MRRPVLSLFGLLLLLCCSGAQCVPKSWPRFPGKTAGAPRMLPDNPSKQQIIDVVNANSAKVRAYATSNATLTGAGMPTLKSRIALERPRRFRLTAGITLLGTEEIDLGSNDQLFWLWVGRGKPAGVYYCRHDQAISAAAQQIVPIEPQWLIDALGLPTFAADMVHSGPYQGPDETLEIRSRSVTQAGDRFRVTVVEQTRGWVLQQHLYTADGRHLASAYESGHRYDPETGVSLPTRIEIQMPLAGLSLKIDVGDVVINQPVGDAQAMWSRPNPPGVPLVDLATFTPPASWSLLSAAPPASRQLEPERRESRLRLPFRRHHY